MVAPVAAVTWSPSAGANTLRGMTIVDIRVALPAPGAGEAAPKSARSV